MATVALTTSSATLDPGTAYELTVLNSGTVSCHVQIGGGVGYDERLRPGQQTIIYPNGSAVTAFVRSGTGEVTTALSTNPETASSGGGAFLTTAAASGTYLQVLVAEKYGAVGDAREAGDGAITGGANVLTSATMAFTPADIGKQVFIVGAGAASAQFYSTITGYTNATTVTLADNAGTTVSAAIVAVGTDDTTALDATFADAAASKTAVIKLRAKGYWYNGAGLGAQTPRISGAGGQVGTTIYLGAGRSLIVSPGGGSPAAIAGIDCPNLRTVGGYGVVRLTYTGSQSGNYEKCLPNLRCEYFSGAAISSLSSDDPFWRITGTIRSRNGASTIGVALAGESDGNEIDVNFHYCRVDIKLGQGGNNAHLRGVHVSAGYQGFPRIPIWIVPHTSATNSGSGLDVRGFKFGGENQNAADYRIVYADADAASGTDFSNQFPALATPSTGYISGHTVTDGEFGGAAAVPIVFTTTPNVRGCSYKGVLVGTTPTYYMQYLSAPGVDYLGTNNTFDIRVADATSGIDGPPVPLTNGAGAPGYIIDPAQLLSGQPVAPLNPPGGGDLAGYIALLAAGIRAFTLINSTTASNVTDSRGGTDASEVTFTLSTGDAYNALTLPTVGVPVWVEADLRQGTSSPQTSVRLMTQYTANGATHWARTVTLGTTWRRYRFLYTPRAAATGVLVHFGVPAGVTPGSVQIGRVRVYHAYEPVPVEQSVTGGSTNRGQVAYTGGNIAFTSTTWAEVNSGLQIPLAASVGDVIEFGVNLKTLNEAIVLCLDAAATVGGVLQHFGVSGGGASHQGALGWQCDASAFARASGSILYTVQTSDLSSGIVTMTLAGRVTTAGTKTIQAAANLPLTVNARNLR